jgi:hypothetical protein
MSWYIREDPKAAVVWRFVSLLFRLDTERHLFVSRDGHAFEVSEECMEDLVDQCVYPRVQFVKEGGKDSGGVPVGASGSSPVEACPGAPKT